MDSFLSEFFILPSTIVSCILVLCGSLYRQCFFFFFFFFLKSLENGDKVLSFQHFT